MKNLALVATLLLLLAPASRAQTVITYSPTTAPATGTLTSSTLPDAVTMPILGSQYATARFQVPSAGTATATLRVSNDGVNWVAAPYAKKLTAAAANPTVQAITATTLVTGDVWEVGLPADAVGLQLVCAGTGTATSVQLLPGSIYVPNTPVEAVLFDATVTAGGANNTGTLQGSGWLAVNWHITVATATTGALSINEVDDAGTALPVASIASLVVGNYAGAIGIGTSMGTAITPVTGLTQIPVPKRFNFALAGATTSSIHLRAVGTR